MWYFSYFDTVHDEWRNGQLDARHERHAMERIMARFGDRIEWRYGVRHLNTVAPPGKWRLVTDDDSMSVILTDGRYFVCGELELWESPYIEFVWSDPRVDGDQDDRTNGYQERQSCAAAVCGYLNSLRDRPQWLDDMQYEDDCALGADGMVISVVGPFLTAAGNMGVEENESGLAFEMRADLMHRLFGASKNQVEWE